MNKSRVVGIFSILSALSYLTVGISHFLMPPEQLHFAHGITARFFLSLSKDATFFHIHYWSFVIGSLLAMGVFICVRVAESDSLLYRITRMWAIIGLALTAIDFSRMHATALRLAGGFSSYSDAVKDVITAYGIDRLDAYYGISFNLIGIYIFYLNYLSIRSRSLPRFFNIS